MFVYGTLRRGGIYHGLVARSSFLLATQTPAAFTLVDLGWCPGLLKGGRTAVKGEVYAVDDGTLARLDILEEHPDVYVREFVLLPSFGRVQTYFLRPEHARNARPILSGDWLQGSK